MFVDIREHVRSVVKQLLREAALTREPFILNSTILRAFADKRNAAKRYSWNHDSAEFYARHLADDLDGDEEVSVMWQGQKHTRKVKDSAQEQINNIQAAVNGELTAIREKVGDFSYDYDNLLISVFDQEEFDDKNLHPFPIYISATHEPYDSIGIMALGGGRYEMFEENEEATNETYQMATTLLGLGGQKKRVYAAHNEELVLRIQKERRLPKDLYVSPIASYAKGYWSSTEQRVLFSCEVAMDDIRMESDVDWKTSRETVAGKFNWIGNI